MFYFILIFTILGLACLMFLKLWTNSSEKPTETDPTAFICCMKYETGLRYKYFLNGGCPKDSLEMRRLSCSDTVIKSQKMFYEQKNEKLI